VIPWIYVNSSRELSLNRFVNLTDSKQWSQFARSDAYDELRCFYDGREDYTSSLIWAEKAYEENNRNRRLLLNLAGSYNNAAFEALKNDKISIAEQYFLSADKCSPESLQILNNIGAFYFNIREYPKAIEYFRKSFTIQPDNLEALRCLVIAYKKIEKHEESNRYNQIIRKIKNNKNPQKLSGIIEDKNRD